MSSGLNGATLVLKNLSKLSSDIRSSAEKAVDGVVEGVLNESKMECPVDTGTLRRSGKPELTKDKDNYYYVLGYNMEYALEVHENLYANHKVGKAKYLEDPVNRAAPTLLNKIEFAMRKDLK